MRFEWRVVLRFFAIGAIVAAGDAFDNSQVWLGFSLIFASAGLVIWSFE